MRLIALTLGLALAAPAFADEPPAAPKPDKDKVVCKTERPTGSRIPTKVCMTRAEWEAVTDASKDALQSRGVDRGTTDNRMSAPGVGG